MTTGICFVGLWQRWRTLFSPFFPVFWLWVQKIAFALKHSPLVGLGGRVWGEQHLHVTLNSEAMILQSERPATATNQTHFPTRSAWKNTPQLTAAESCFLNQAKWSRSWMGRKHLMRHCCKCCLITTPCPQKDARWCLAVLHIVAAQCFTGLGNSSGLPSPKAQDSCWAWRAAHEPWARASTCHLQRAAVSIHSHWKIRKLQGSL